MQNHSEIRTEKTKADLLSKAARQKFYNTSEYSLETLPKFPNDIAVNFNAYLGGFSTNIKDILYNFSGGEVSKTETDPGFGKFFFSEMFEWYEKSVVAGKRSEMRRPS